MTSGAFIGAMRRFTSHHSIPRVIYSDNASTFVSSSNILNEFFKHPDVAKELANMRITWKFIPKRAPWYGGWWERLIALTKNSLRKMVGRTRLTLVQMQTVFAQIEAILNDRPLMRVPTDIISFEPPTPAHLLYGRRMMTLPSHYAADEELEDPTYGRATEPLILSKAYLRTRNVLIAFWRRWSTFYLPSLREHQQATKGTLKEVIKIGDVMQIHQEAPATSSSVFTIQDPSKSVSSNPIPITEEMPTRAGRIQRKAAQQAVRKIKRVAIMETVEEENQQSLSFSDPVEDEDMIEGRRGLNPIAYGGTVRLVESSLDRKPETVLDGRGNPCTK
ncbi:uncharacterized protein LOC130688068 [Daphnia carinata]|uniref:uncharacterized protein LOC130688068 n=1 Tax=Daphnia carinata TaxID=120202 RepID=UPI00257F2578|nr:uncharacterized protein LOC130688068 [Daphnia carinata]